MSGIFNIEKNFEYISKGSLTGLIILVLILFLTYYDLFKYFNIEVNGIFIFFAWIYVILNIGVANIWKYTNEKKLPECPKCNSKLEIDRYKCKKCGKLHFKK